MERNCGPSPSLISAANQEEMPEQAVRSIVYVVDHCPHACIFFSQEASPEQTVRAIMLPPC